jgi:hypothetical protein
MSDITNQELKELILGLDNKIEVEFIKIRDEIKQLKIQIKDADEKINDINKRQFGEQFIVRSSFITFIVAFVIAIIKQTFYK